MDNSFDKVVDSIVLLGKPAEEMEKYNEEHGCEEKKKYLVIEELLVDTLARLNPEKYGSLNIRESDVRGAYLHEVINVLTAALQHIKETHIIYGVSVNNKINNINNTY